MFKDYLLNFIEKEEAYHIFSSTGRDQSSLCDTPLSAWPSVPL